MAFSLQIAPSQSGTYVDLTNYIALGGVKWSRNDIDAAGAGRDQAGLLHRARVAIKIRLDITCRPLLASEAKTVLDTIAPEWIWVKYLDVQSGTVLTKKMYSNNIPATYLMKQGNKEYWTGITFPLIEQ